MLRIAEAKARAAGVSIDFVRMDMRSLDLEGVFDAVTIFFSSIQYVGPWRELVSFLRKLRNHLKTGGVVVFDASNPLYLGAAAEGKPYVWDVSCENGDRLFMVDHREVDPFAQTMRFKMLVNVLREGRLVKTVLVDLIYLYTVNEYKLDLEQAGFEVAAVYKGYGELRGRPSDRRVVVVRKAV